MVSITKALTSIESLFPIVRKLIVKNKRQSVEESVLEQLIYLLSDSAIHDLSCAAINENYLPKKVPAYHKTSSFGDLSDSLFLY